MRLQTLTPICNSYVTILCTWRLWNGRRGLFSKKTIKMALYFIRKTKYGRTLYGGKTKMPRKAIFCSKDGLQRPCSDNWNFCSISVNYLFDRRIHLLHTDIHYHVTTIIYFPVSSFLFFYQLFDIFFNFMIFPRIPKEHIMTQRSRIFSDDVFSYSS